MIDSHHIVGRGPCAPTHKRQFSDPPGPVGAVSNRTGT